MRQYRSKIVSGIVILIIGVIIGALFFGSNGKTPDKEAVHEHTEEDVKVWTCSMHPQIRLPESGSCPICGMDLIPLTDGNGVNTMAIQMSERAMQLADIQTTVVGSGNIAKSLQLTGKVKVDERLNYNLTAHFPGRIEKLYVNYTGEYIKKGQVVASLYSPDMVTAQEELFEALKFGNSVLINSARKKLKLWKLSDAEIAKIESRGTVTSEVPLTSDVSGVVISKEVSLGNHVPQGGTLFKVADLKSVWVVFDAYESDLQWISVGDAISFQIPSIPGKTFDAKISFIEPTINPTTRVALVRIEMKNPNGLLKPEMLVNGAIKGNKGDSSKGLTVPKSAVMWTGKRSVVYVKVPDSNVMAFEMREITLGEALNDNYVVVDGLSSGEELVTNGTFSVDAAAQLQGKKSMMNPQGGPVSTAHNHGTSDIGQGKPTKMVNSAMFRHSLTNVVNEYLKLKDAFVKSDPKATQASAKRTLQLLDEIPMKELTNEQHVVWMQMNKALREALNAIVSNPSIEVQRQQFEIVSNNLTKAVQTFGIVGDVIYEQRCPMVNQGKGAIWLSSSKEVQNPYYGEAMLKCGEVILEIKPQN